MTGLMPTYSRLPVAFLHGEGAYLYDESGNRYLDAVAGVAVCGLGHAHPAVREALCQQAGQVVHTSNLYRIPKQEELAAEVCRLSGMDAVFFGNSGAEANEAAIKLARRYGHAKGIAQPRILVMDNSFHGRTLATLSATGNAKIQQGFEPLVEGYIRVPYNDVAAIAAAEHPEIVAVLVEPVQGEGGVRVPTPGYLRALRTICDERGWLMMLDEIQTGMGRTGAWFAFQHEGIQPDVITLAKALGNGVPIGACVARGDVATVLTAGSHGSTFGGNPLACAAALAVIRTIEQHGLVQHAALMGYALVDQLRARLRDCALVKDIRGKGLMIGIELHRPCTELPQQALQARLLINVTAGSTIRLLPPLIINPSQAEFLVDTLCTLIDRYAAEPPLNS